MQFFNPSGTPQEIAQAITLAINQGISPEKRFFVASYNDDTIYVQSRFGGSRFNRLSFEIDFIQYEKKRGKTEQEMAFIL